MFLTACGLDQVYFINAPYSVENPPEYNSGYDNREFVFTTNEKKEFDDFVFNGTEIYYKIYSRYNDELASNDLYSERASISSITNSDNFSNVVTKMKDSYGYKLLYVYDESNKSSKPCMIPFTEKNKKVRIRLTNYFDLPEYRAKVTYREGNGEEISFGSYPVRNNTNLMTFDFGRSGDGDKKPQSGDEDVSYTDFEPGADNTFYVALYAVAVGRDLNFTTYYSNVLYLGCVPISTVEEHN